MEKKIENKGFGDFLKKRVLMGERTSLYIALLAMVIWFMIAIPTFFTWQNILAILTSAVTMGFVAIGESYVIISGHTDLSCGAVAAFGSAMIALLLKYGWNVWLAIFVVLVMGAIWGVCSAVLINELNFQAFIATYAVSSVVRGFAYVLTDAKSISVSNPTFIALSSTPILGIKLPVWMLIIFLIVFSIILKFTVFGRNVYAIGGNATASRLAGINSKIMVIKLYILSAIMATLGGIILTSRMHSGLPNSSESLHFEGMCAAILGGISFAGGSGNMIGTILGIFILQGFNNGLQVMGLSSYWQYVARGALLIFALAFDGIRNRVMSKA